MAAKVPVAADEYRGNAQGSSHIGVHEELRSKPSVEFNVIGLAVHGMGQRASAGAGRRVVSHKHEGVKAFVQAADHGIRGVFPAQDDFGLLGKKGDIHVPAGVMGIFNIDFRCAGCQGASACRGCLQCHFPG